MDSITHIALGACAGEVLAGRKLGKKALVIGAFANSIPDFDFVSSFFLDVDNALLAHRGFTHSFLFGGIATVGLAYLFRRWFRSKNMALKAWLLYFGAEIFLHLFIDAFNTYGIGWFEPFSHNRVTFNTIFVVDPFYSIWLWVAFVVLLIMKMGHKHRQFWLRFGLGLSSIYLFYCILNKFKTDRNLRSMLKKQHISYTHSFTTPAALNNWLWYVVAGNDNGYYIGYYSVFDSKNKIELHYYPKNEWMLIPIKDNEDLKNLKRFSKGFYTAERVNDTLVFNDLRFGQVVGWYNPDAKFVFHYYLQHPRGNRLVVQRARFAEYNWTTMKALIRRIKGN